MHHRYHYQYKLNISLNFCEILSCSLLFRQRYQVYRRGWKRRRENIIVLFCLTLQITFSLSYENKQNKTERCNLNFLCSIRRKKYLFYDLKFRVYCTYITEHGETILLDLERYETWQFFVRQNFTTSKSNSVFIQSPYLWGKRHHV